MGPDTFEFSLHVKKGENNANHKTYAFKEHETAFPGHQDILITQRYVHYDKAYIKENMNNIEELYRIFK